MNLPWVCLMAWRDGRHSWRRLLLYISSIVLGVSALVAVRSLSENLTGAVEDQARTLLGADLTVRSRRPFPAEAEELFRVWGGQQARQTEFSTMAYFPDQDQTRLVQVRAVSGPFPFYGRLVTDPLDAANQYQLSRDALVDETLMLQFGVNVGDRVKLGNGVFRIAGRLLEIPGEAAVVSDVAPRIFIAREYVEETGLIQVGSRVGYRIMFKFPEGTDPDLLIKAHEDDLRRLELSTDTVAERKEDFRREMTNLSRFLSLVGFVALVLGGVGVASSINLYVRQRLGVVAILRCIGASPAQSLAIHIVQAAVLGLTGAGAGVFLGLAVQGLVPLLFADLLPFQFEQGISWPAVGEGMAVGLLTALLFSIVPLAPVRRISPLLTLRSDTEPVSPVRDPVVVVLAAVSAAILLLLAIRYAPDWTVGLGFFAGLCVVIGLLFGVAKGIMVMARRFMPGTWRYEWRQGLANLYRPHNQTVVLMMAVGLGTFFIATLYLVQSSLLQQVQEAAGGDRPNLVFFDIQSDQTTELLQLVKAREMPLLQQVPIVAMRIRAINGQTVEELRRAEGYQGRRILLREFRSTYRERLSDSEKLLEGEFQGVAGPEDVRISLEEEIASELRVGLGDQITFDVQGIELRTRVGSIRAVNWRRFQPNFFMVFPAGVLETAPQFHVIVTRARDSAQSAALQRDVVKAFPNVSAIDISLVLRTVDAILGRLSFVIQFMALFTILTGLLVMISAIFSGRYQRLRESILLRTLGASRVQIRSILLIEYFFVGVFSALTGLVLSLGAGWGLCLLVFETAFVADLRVFVGVMIAVISLTILVGMANSRGLFDQPPLRILKAEE